MLELWRKTFELLRSHPILWLPYIFAELLATFLWRIRTAVAKEVFEWFTTTRTVSVFGTIRTPNLDYQDRLHAAAAYGPVGFAAELTCVYLLVFALVVTSGLLELIFSEQEPDLKSALKSATVRWRAILWFSFKALFVALVLMAITMIPLVSLLSEAHPNLFQSPILLSAVVLILGASAAWLLIPAAFRLLQNSKREIIDSNVRTKGVVCAIVATSFTIGLGFIAPKLGAVMQLDTPAEFTVVCIMVELLVNSAFAPLLVALSLLAFRWPNETQVQQNGLT
jgi:hypothetical protein